MGVLSFGWPGAHEVDTDEETLLVGTADLAAAAITRVPGGLDGVGAGRVAGADHAIPMR